MDQTREMNGQAETISTDVPPQMVLVEPQDTVTTRPQWAGSDHRHCMESAESSEPTQELQPP